LRISRQAMPLAPLWCILARAPIFSWDMLMVRLERSV
jgi:hypothetical protein